MTKDTFNGFSRELPKFLTALAKNNKREWFDAHRSEYQQVYAEPAKDFAAAIGGPLGRMAKGTLSEPRVNGSIWRINRDTRFSKDKTPYKAHLSMVFPHGPTFDRKRPAFYFRLNGKSLFLGAGAWDFDPAMLKKYRNAAADSKRGGALAKAISGVEKAGDWTLGKPYYKQVPRGFDKELPTAWLLKYKGVHMGTEMGMPPELFSPGAVDFVVGKYREVRPFHAWLVNELA